MFYKEKVHLLLHVGDNMANDGNAGKDSSSALRAGDAAQASKAPKPDVMCEAHNAHGVSGGKER
jgi:hypothetical protein